MGLQNKPIVIGTPVEVEKAVNSIRETLDTLDWITHPYFVAQKFHRSVSGKNYVYPETYCRVPSDAYNKYDYARLTPDNDYTGMVFFMVEDGTYDEFNSNDVNYINYPVSAIFSVNLEKIDSVKLDNGLFTQELMKEVRQKLKSAMPSYTFKASITKETRDLAQCYREFQLDDLEQYNRAPLQCFRFEFELVVPEECP